MAQIALAWSMAQDMVAAPIVGTTSLKNLQDLLGTHVLCLYKRMNVLTRPCSGAIDITLTAEEIKYLEEPYQPKSVVGHR